PLDPDHRRVRPRRPALGAALRCAPVPPRPALALAGCRHRAGAAPARRSRPRRDRAGGAGQGSGAPHRVRFRARRAAPAIASLRRLVGLARATLGGGGLGALRGARSAGGLALLGAALLQLELVARGARAEDEPEEHPDHERARDEEDVARGHLPSLVSLAAASRSRRSWSISARNHYWRRSR